MIKINELSMNKYEQIDLTSRYIYIYIYRERERWVVLTLDEMFVCLSMCLYF